MVCVILIAPRKKWTSYLVAVLAGCSIGWILGSVLERFKKNIAMIDAAGLGAHSVGGIELEESDES
jgi:uncharacterized membrane protein YeiH